MSGFISRPSEVHEMSKAIDKADEHWWRWLMMIVEEDQTSLSVPTVSIALSGMVIGLILNVLFVQLIVKLSTFFGKGIFNSTSSSEKDKATISKDGKETLERIIIIEKVNLNHSSGCGRGTGSSTLTSEL